MDKKKKRKRRKEKKRKGDRACRRERERKGKKGFCFSLRSTEIGSSVFVGARSKVNPRNEGYTWVPKSRSFIKLQEIGNFPTLIISSLKVI